MQNKLSQKDKIMLLVLALVLIGFGAYMLPSVGISAMMEKKSSLEVDLTNAKAAYEESTQSFYSLTGKEYDANSYPSASSVKAAMQKSILNAKLSATQQDEYYGKSPQDMVASYVKARSVYDEYLAAWNRTKNELDEEVYLYFDETVYQIMKDSPTEVPEENKYNYGTFIYNDTEYSYCFRDFKLAFIPISRVDDGITDTTHEFLAKQTDTGIPYYVYNIDKYLDIILDYWGTLFNNVTACIGDFGTGLSFDTTTGEVSCTVRLYMTQSAGLSQYDIQECPECGKPYDHSDPSWQNDACLYCGADLTDVNDEEE